MATTRLDDAYLRRLIAEYFGAGARLRILRKAPAFGAPIFVVDFDRGVRHYRTFGSFGPCFGMANPEELQVTEQSSMDLLYPAHLVFHYERLMSLAFALCERPVSALLLGVGGAAMWRFLRAYVPECSLTLVDAEESVAAIAKRWFYLSQPVVIEPAQRFLAGNAQRFDVVLVDLYDAGGPAAFDEAFWARCIDALAPGGCLATNWADFATNRGVRPMAEAQQRVARGPRSRFLLRDAARLSRQSDPVFADRQRAPARGDHRRTRALCARAPPARPRPLHPRALPRIDRLPDRLLTAYRLIAARRARSRAEIGCGTHGRSPRLWLALSTVTPPGSSHSAIAP